MSNTFQVLSIDIGVKNLAMWIEEYDVNQLASLKKECEGISPKVDSNNIPSKPYADFIKKFLVSSKSVYYDKLDLTTGKERRTKNKAIILENETLFNIIKEFDKRKDIFIHVNYIVIEKQLKTNPMAQTVQNHVHAYFLHQYGLTKDINIFDSVHKTRVLGCPKKITKEDKLVKINKAYRKKWTTNKTRDIMMERKDKKTFKFIFEENKAKADDLSDTFCQSSAFVFIHFIN